MDAGPAAIEAALPPPCGALQAPCPVVDASRLRQARCRTQGGDLQPGGHGEAGGGGTEAEPGQEEGAGDPAGQGRAWQCCASHGGPAAFLGGDSLGSGCVPWRGSCRGARRATGRAGPRCAPRQVTGEEGSGSRAQRNTGAWQGEQGSAVFRAGRAELELGKGRNPRCRAVCSCIMTRRAYLSFQIHIVLFNSLIAQETKARGIP